MNRILLFLFLPLFICCSEEEKKSPTVLFAGEIVNPTSEYVVLFKDDVVIDSAKLDSNNRFSFKIDSINEGLHHFSHSPEIQYIYLKDSDSIMLRLNTIDFDESLVFSGKGEEINNFLINMFLANEDENYLIKNSLCPLEPKEFEHQLDSLKSLKLNELAELKSNVELTDKAIKIAKASIDYNYYMYKELYPFYHKKKKGEKTIHDLPNFYAYRKNVDYNDENLTYLRPYYRYMVNHFNNLSYLECAEKCDYGSKALKNKLHFNTHKLKIIDSLAKGKELRDNLFRNVAVEYLINAKDNKENNKAFIDIFHQYSKNNKHISEINDLYEGIMNVQTGNEVPEVKVVDFEGNSLSIKDIAKNNENVVFYFWSNIDKMHFKNVTTKVKLLSEKHPNHQFVGINLRTDELRWKTMVNSNQLDKGTQYRAMDDQALEHSLIVFFDRNKCVITKDGLIVDAFANLYRSF